MAATVFTSWSDLLQALLNAYADFVAKRIQYAEYQITAGGIDRRYRFQDPDKLLKAINEIRPLAAIENGSVVGRTYAKNGGRA